MTVAENVEVALSGFSSLLHSFTFRKTAAIQDKFMTFWKKFNLYNQRDLLPVYLSHGQRQWLEWEWFWPRTRILSHWMSLPPA